MVPQADTKAVPTLTLGECSTLSAEELTALMMSGGLEVTVDGALSEWGSRVDDLLHKLENNVLKWRADGEVRTLMLRFREPASREGPKANFSEAEEGVVTLKAD